MIFKLAGAVAVLAGVANADTPRKSPTRIEVDRDDAPPGRVELGFDSGAPVEAWGVSTSVGYLDEPIAQAVERRETLALGGALAVGGAVIDLRVAAAHQVGARLGDGERLARFVFEDLRMGARLSVTTGVFVRGELVLPTGADHDFAGDARWSAAVSIIGRAPLPHGVVLAGQAGIRLRGAEVQVGDRVVCDEGFGAAGVTVPVVATVRATAELVGVLGDNVAKRRGPSPAEARIGAIVQLDRWAIGARIGAGLDDQIGAPRVRALVDVAYVAR